MLNMCATTSATNKRKFIMENEHKKS